MGVYGTAAPSNPLDLTSADSPVHCHVHQLHACGMLRLNDEKLHAKPQFARSHQRGHIW